ncbi:hemagglutinin repeat-containing protein [Acinetobacter guerrae]|uniref:hemagglutinin repeat-containing protein n=1 Tax=Acinetobacter guerrae TaxID=1843371 RepID=UPI0012600AE8|nr:hemagglutinin repeat-containing protein [Acinetobacter guerrae]
MNHIYKTVWNKAKNAFDVVSENVSAKGKATGTNKNNSVETQGTDKKLRSLFAATLIPMAAMLFFQTTFANVEAVSGSNTQVYNANNGVQIIDIATANAAGISHNRFINYNVDKTGQILNNAAQSANQMSVMTELAGKIRTNANLDRSANVILNEVVGTNRSNLNGYTEVAGSRADVIITNPYGITCAGCGFINTDRVTLTTGTPNFAENGSLLNFNVARGDILISDKGVDATAQSLLQLLSRSIKVDGQINAQDLKIVTGANQIDASTGQIQSISTTDAVPEYAIDSTQLGGIYANRISLISTDQGVGVRTLGNVAASGSDFTLLASGKIELNNKISAQEKLSIQNSSNTNNALNINSSLAAKNVELGSAENNHLNIAVNNGSVYAINNLSVNVNQLTAKNAVLQAEATNTLKSTVNVDLAETKIRAGDSLKLESQSLNTTGATSLSSSKDSINLNTIDNIVLGNGIEAIAQKNVNFIAQGNVDIGTGQIKSNANDFNVKAMNISSNVTSSAVDTNLAATETLQLQHQGSASSTDTATLQAKSISVNGKSYAKENNLKAEKDIIIDNQGVVSSTVRDNLEAQDITIKGQLLGGNVDINATNKLQTDAGAIVYADKVASLNAKNASLSAEHSATDLNVNILEALTLGKTGSLIAANNVVADATQIDVLGQINATNAKAKATNGINLDDSSVITAAEKAQLDAKNLSLSGTIKAQNVNLKAFENTKFTQTSNIGASNKALIESNSVDVDGSLTATDVELDVVTDLNVLNKGKIEAANSTQLNANNISVAGKIIAKNANLNVNNDLVLTSSAEVKATETAQMIAKNISTDGYIQAQNANLTALEQLTLNNNGLIEAANNAALNSLTGLVDGKIAVKNLQINSTSNLDLSNTSKLSVNDTVQLNANQMTIDGEIQAKNVNIATVQSLLLKEKADVAAANKAMINADSTTIQGKVVSKETQIVAKNNADLTKTSTLISQDKVQIDAKNVDLVGQLTTTNALLMAQDSLTINGIAKLNAVEKNILTANDMFLSGNIVSKNNDITAKNQLTSNVGLNLVSQQSMKIQAKNADLSGSFIALDANILADQTLNLKSDSEVFAVNRLDLKATDIHVQNQTQATDIYASATGDINLDQGSLVIADNIMDLQAENNIDLKSQTGAKNLKLTAGNNASTLNNSLSSISDILEVNAKNINLDGRVYTKNIDLISKNEINTLQDAIVSVNNNATLNSWTLNNNAFFYVGNKLTSNLNSIVNNANLQTNSIEFNNLKGLINNGLLLSQEDLLITTDKFENKADAYLLSGKNLTLTVNGNSFNNSGNIIANSALTVDAKKTNLTNSGILQAIAKDLKLTTKTVNNTGSIESGLGIQVSGENVDNVGVITAKTVGVSAQGISSSSIKNTGNITALNQINLDAAKLIRNEKNIYTSLSGGVGLKSSTIENIDNNDAKYVGLNTGILDIQAANIKNSGSIQTNKLNITGTKTSITNTANVTDPNKGIFVFDEIQASDLGTVDNQGNLYIGIGSTDFNKSSMKISELKTSAIGFTYLKGLNSLLINDVSNNAGQFYILNSGNGGSSAKINKFSENKGIFTLIGSKVQVDSNLNNVNIFGKINLFDDSLLDLDKYTLNNNGEINLLGKTASGSVLKADTINNFATKGQIFSYGVNAVNANLLNNYGGIVGREDSVLSINATQLNNMTNAGLLSLGVLNLNNDITTTNTINNNGNIFGGEGLVIGNSNKTSNIRNWNKQFYTSVSEPGNIFANDAVFDAGLALSAVNGTLNEVGGSIIGGKGMVISANDFTNNYQVLAESGDITINAKTFLNETSYFGKSLAVSNYEFTKPMIRQDVINQYLFDGEGKKFYFKDGNVIADKNNYDVYIYNLLTEGNDNDEGIGLAHVQEIWNQKTITRDGILNNNANAYLNNNGFKGAALSASAGNVNLNVDNNGKNYGGKIYALGGDVNIKMGSALNRFDNQVIDLYDARKYLVEYMLVNNNFGSTQTYGYVFIKDNTVTDNNKKGLIISSSGVSDDDATVTKYTNKYIGDLLSNVYLVNSMGEKDQTAYDYMTLARNSLYSYGNTSAVLQDTTPTLGGKNGKAIITSTGLVNVNNGILSNVGIGGGVLADKYFENEYFTVKENIDKTEKDKINASVKEGASKDKCVQDSKDPTCITDTKQKTIDNQASDLSKDIDGLTNIDAKPGDTPTTETTDALDPKNVPKASDAPDAPEEVKDEPTAPAESEKIEIVTPPKPTYTVYPTENIPKLDLTIPTGDYGRFVANEDPKAAYLVERNPLYGAQSDVLGSSYLVKQLGIDPNKILKRLGDDSYEGNLVQQQITQIAGSGVLYANMSASQQMQKLFDNAVVEKGVLGLEYGKEPTAEQLTKLTTDIIWMVTKEVSGQKVLVPQVYLSKETIDGINTSGAVIGGKVGTILNVSALNNVNATVDGGLVYVDALNNINNIGGRIKGDDIVLKSQEGSINNITEVFSTKSKGNSTTSLGQTAGIESNGTLMLDAAKNINNIGADLKSKGDALIKAGNDINIQSLEIFESSTEKMKKGERINENTKSIGNGTKQTTEITHKGSNVDLGGNASFESGGDTTISGSDVNVKGQMYAKTGGDFILESVQDSLETTTNSSRSGFGVGGGLYGTQTQTTHDFDGKNKASNLNVGSLIVDSDNKVIITGSNINIADKDSLSMISGTKGVDVLDGKDEKYREKETVTTTFLKVTTGPSKSSAGTNTYASASSNAQSDGKSASAGADARAGASAQASAEGSASLRLMEHTVERTTSESEKSVGSNITSAGSLLIASEEGTATVRGSNIDVQGALGIKAQDIAILAGQNKETSTHDKKQTSIGIYVEGSASANAGASAEASAKAQAGLSANPASANANANAGASANASAEGMATFGGLHETSSATSSSLTHNKSTLKSGGDMSLTADNTVLFQGAAVNAGNNLDIRGKDIINKAVKDEHTTTQSNSSHLAGYFIGAKVEVSGQAEAHADATTGKFNPSASAGASATGSVSAEINQGLRTVNSQSSETDIQTTHTGNSFSAGGNMTRVATNTIFDEATQVDVDGGFAQKATTIIDHAVNDTHTVTKDSQTHNATVSFGVSGTGTAGMSMEAKVGKESSTTTSKTAPKSPSLSLGVSASYEGAIDHSHETSTVARTSSFKAGGDITSISTGDTTLTGTQFKSGGNVNIAADKLTFNAAENTTKSSSTGQKIGASAGAEFDITGKLKSANIDGSYGNTQSQSQSSTAVVGGITAAGNINVMTNTGASFEGTQLLGGGDTSISGKVVDFKAAQNASSSSKTTHDASVGVKVGSSAGGKVDSAGANLGYGHGQTTESSSQAVVSNVIAGGALRINADQASFEGTNLATVGNTSIVANTVDFTAARDKSSSENLGVKVGLSASGAAKTEGKTGSSSAGINAGFDKGQSSSDTARVGSITSGGQIDISTKNASFEGTKFASNGDTNISGSTVSFTAAKSTSSGSNLGLGVGVNVTVPQKDAPAPTTAPAPVITPPTPQPAPAGATPIVKSTTSAPATTTPSTSTVAAAPATEETKQPRTEVNGGVQLKVGTNKQTSYEGSTFETGTGGKLNINADQITIQNTDTSGVTGDTNYSTGPIVQNFEDSKSGFNVSGGVSGVGTNTIKQVSAAKDAVTGVKKKISETLGLSTPSTPASGTTLGNGVTNSTGGATNGTPANNASPGANPPGAVTVTTTVNDDTTTTVKKVNTIDALKGLFTSTPAQPTAPLVITPPTPQAPPAGAIPIVKPEPQQRLPIPAAPTTPLRNTNTNTYASGRS